MFHKKITCYFILKPNYIFRDYDLCHCPPLSYQVINTDELQNTQMWKIILCGSI